QIGTAVKSHAVLVGQPFAGRNFGAEGFEAGVFKYRYHSEYTGRNTQGIMTSDEWSIDQPGRGALVPGTQIGVYRIESPLGEGGMGTVYRAFDTKLNRPVALKVLSNELADANARRRFQREAQMASSLNHPHILTVHDAGEYEGRQYLVMEFVDGGTLKDWAKAEKRNWRQVVELLGG